MPQRREDTKVHNKFFLNERFLMLLRAFVPWWPNKFYNPLFRYLILVMFFSFLILTKSCIEPYKPEPTENEEMLVVEGMITDQYEVNTIKLSKSLPLWRVQNAKALKGCKVWITDDLGEIDSLKETFVGTYVTNPATFQGTVGRKYTLNINTTPVYGNLRYESIPMEMKPVPQIDRIYYEKKVFSTYPREVEGCQIYLDTHDPTSNCNFYRWKFTETWEFQIPFDVKNKVCWITGNSREMLIKNATSFSEDKIERFPLLTIDNPIDKLSVKYSMLVKQYSLNEDEYLYWERLKNTSDQIGGLYDMIPAIIPNNIYCIENPNEKILGYFGVSAVSSMRVFIKDTFSGQNMKYAECIADTIYGTKPLEGEDLNVWVIVNNLDKIPPSRVVTFTRGCADCTVRGTNVKPLFWDEDKL
jgi:hypothetical protein